MNVKQIRILLIATFVLIFFTITVQECYAIRGELKVLVIPVMFPDKEPFARSALIGYTINSLLSDYLAEVSYGKLRLNLRVADPVNLTSLWSEFESYPYEDAVLEKLIALTLNRTLGTSEDITDYTIIMIVHNGPCNYKFCAKGGYSTINGFGKLRYVVIPFASPKAYYVYALLSSLGLKDQPKADGWTPMGTPIDPENPPHPLSSEKVKMGWMDYDKEIKVIQRGKHAEEVLYKLSSTAGSRALVLPLTETYSLYIEYRYAEGQDSSIPRNGVIIYLYNHPSGISEILKSLWTNEIYIDKSFGFAVKVLKADPISATVFVSNGLPDLTVLSVAYKGEIIPGEEIELNVTVKNTGNAESLPFIVKVKNGEASFESPMQMGLAPGETQTVKLRARVGLGGNKFEIHVVTELDSDLRNNAKNVTIVAPSKLIVKDFFTPRERFDVGSEAVLQILLVRDSDGLPASGAVVEYNGKRFTSNSSGYVTIPVSSNNIGKLEVLPRLLSYHGITVLEFETRPFVIFDAVEISVINRPPERVDVGSEVNIEFYAKYVYDGKPFEGALKFFNNTIIEGKGIFNLTLRKNEVGKVTVQVESIVDPVYGLTKVLQKTVSVVWDMVLVELRSDKKYYNVGERAHITWVAKYAYDGKPFKGDIVLSEENPVATTPKELNVTVVKVVDELYGLEKFASNTLTLAWDRVSITLSTEFNRYEVGSSVPIKVVAYYELDGAPFDGTVNLSPKPECKEIGNLTVSVGSLIPGKRGITAFTANKVSVKCDLIQSSITFDGTVFGYAKTILNLKYKSDGRPVNGKVLINNKSVSGMGKYVLEEPFYGLVYHAKGIAKVPGFRELVVESTNIHVGNSLAYCAVASFSVYLVIKILRKLRMRRQVSTEEELEELYPEEEIIESSVT